MAGTVTGGKKASIKNRARDPDFYKKIGAKGGHNGRTGGFASTKVGKDGMTGPQRAILAGRAGGHISRRGKYAKVNTETETGVRHYFGISWLPKRRNASGR